VAVLVLRQDCGERMDKIFIYSLVACAAGVAMLITGLLPNDKMDKVRSFMGDKKQPPDRRMARLQLIVCGAAVLFIALLVLRVIRL
jgi:hypothetical protein